jgi:hypothetical protein
MGLQPAAPGHICKLRRYILQKLRNNLSGRVYHLLFFFNVRPPETAHNNGCGPLSHKGFWARQPSRNVPVDAVFPRDKSHTPRDKIKWTYCILFQVCFFFYSACKNYSECETYRRKADKGSVSIITSWIIKVKSVKSGRMKWAVQADEEKRLQVLGRKYWRNENTWETLRY